MGYPLVPTFAMEARMVERRREQQPITTATAWGHVCITCLQNHEHKHMHEAAHTIILTN